MIMRILIIIGIMVFPCMAQDEIVTPQGEKPLISPQGLQEVAMVPGVGLPPENAFALPEEVTWRNRTLWWLAWVAPLGNVTNGSIA